VYNSLTPGQGLGKGTAILAWGLGNNLLTIAFYIATIAKVSGITFVTKDNTTIITSKSNTINFKSKQYGE